MTFIYTQVLGLNNKPKVGSKECVALIQHYASGIGPAAVWKEGEVVYGNKDIVPGTAIATFVNGRYPNHRSGNHAAFFLEQGVNGFWVMDQWRDDSKKPLISKRFIPIRSTKRLKSGRYVEGGNNAYAYAIIER